MFPREPEFAGVVIRENVVADNGIVGGAETFTALEIAREVGADETGGFFDRVHDVCFVHHIPCPHRDKLFEVIGEEFAADVETSDGGVIGLPGEGGHDVRVGETGIDDEGGFGGERGGGGGRGRGVEETWDVVPWDQGRSCWVLEESRLDSGWGMMLEEEGVPTQRK